jgi:hypothetical protein
LHYQRLKPARRRSPRRPRWKGQRLICRKHHVRCSPAMQPSGPDHV